MVNCAGQLIGVPSAGAAVPGSVGGSIGLGFAIPVDLAKAISDEIIATGTVTHAYFGLATVPIPPAAAAQAGVRKGSTSGRWHQVARQPGRAAPWRCDHQH